MIDRLCLCFLPLHVFLLTSLQNPYHGLKTVPWTTQGNRRRGIKGVRDIGSSATFPLSITRAEGEGPFNVDLMSAIMAWVENGSAPFALVASH
jgi:hypothetical protein